MNEALQDDFQFASENNQKEYLKINIGTYLHLQNMRKKKINESTLKTNMIIKFGINKMQQDFQNSIKKNQKIIFNELTNEERIELQQKRQKAVYMIK